MEIFESWIGLIGGVLAIAAVLVSVTRYLTLVQEKSERAKIEAENRQLNERNDELQSRCDRLLEQVQFAGRAGEAALAQKEKIDGELRRITSAIGASGGSVYVPVRGPRGNVHGLAFLSIEPYSFETRRLQSKLIPLRSIAGRCFVSGDSFIVGNAAQQADHFKAADDIAEYTPAMTLNHCLKSEGEQVGVLQLLTKEGEKGFVEADIERVEAMMESLAKNVATLVQSGDDRKLISLGLEQGGEEGSVVFFDLTNSSLLFQELSPGLALQLLNEYFEKMCGIAFEAGAALDNYTGDGALLRFNIPSGLPDHEVASVMAALEMRREFEEIRDYWSSISPQFASLHYRAGVSTGPLLPASIGHPQVQSLTIVGYPIATAAALCDLAPRDRSVVLASAETFEEIKHRVVTESISVSGHEKARNLTKAAYEVVAMR